MSKMDRQLNSKKDKQTIYEIYRACRLCGAGAGYKMPIIQNVVDLEETDVELRQKVRECVQIEVHQDDKMPPLICELCVDKVNDFYEFLEMCRQTNKRTRLRLGLPPQSMPKGAPDAGECILGLTEPVYVNEDSDGEPLLKQKKLQPKVKVKKEPELKVKLEKRILTDTRSSRFRKRPPTPPRMTRHRTISKDENVSLSRLKEKPKPTRVTPKPILRKDTKTEDSSLLTPRLKRSRDKEPVKLETPVKRVKIAAKTSTPHPTPKPSPIKTSPRTAKLSKSPKLPPKRAPSPPRLYKCVVCGQPNKTPQAVSSHMRVHGVSFTNPRLACNPCGMWFLTADEAASHHRRHKLKSKPYTCRRCTADYKYLSAYEEHFDKKQCIPLNEVPDVKCDVCWHLFPTNNLLDDHKCLGEDHRPGGKCGKCNRSYALLKNLKKHEQNCTAKKKGELIVNPVLLGKLKPIQVRVSRCDPLLSNVKQEHYDVSNVTADFGLDKNCVYPFISSVSSLRIKSDPDELDRMVAIKEEIKEEFCTEEDYVHWDSEDSESDEDLTCNLVLNPLAKKKKVDSLANLTLKTLFSKRCLGKVPRKRRRVKLEKSVFDSLLATEAEDNVTRDINNIIDNLGDDDELDGEGRKNITGNGDNCKNEVDDVKDSMDVSDDKITDVDDKDSNVDDKDSNVDDKDSNVDGKDTDEVIDESIDNVVNKTTDVADDKDISDVDGKDAANEKNDRNNAQNDDKLSDVIESANAMIDKHDQIDASNDIGDDEVSNQEKKDISSVCNDITGSNNNLSSNNDNNDDLTRIDDKVKVNNGTINNVSVDNNDAEISKNETDFKVNDILSEVSQDENQNDGNVDSSAKTDADENSSKKDFENSQDSNSIGTVNESVLNDNTPSDVSKNEKENVDISDNATSSPKRNSEVDENKSQADSSPENLNQDTKISELQIDASDAKNSNGQKNEMENQVGRQNNDNINESNYKNAISVIVNSGKTKNPNDSEDMDDSKLMEALDAQIGENNDNSHGQMNDNIALEDFISVKTTEMDIIPDEFSFDA